MTFEEWVSSIKEALKNKSIVRDADFKQAFKTRNYKCKHNKCNVNAYAKGYCNAHYLRNKNGSDMDMPIKAINAKNINCSVCGKQTRKHSGWNLCHNHFKKERVRIIKQTLVKLMGDQCKMCKKSYPLCAYDFHHMTSLKDDDVSTIINTKSIELICHEVKKCIILCSNCHRIFHNEIRGGD